MSTTLDGQMLFDEQLLGLEVGSPIRESLEKSVHGLDGVLSVDLGSRGRRIRQKGVLRAASRAALNKRISAISAFIDGHTHILDTSNNQSYENVRMDSFETKPIQLTGSGVEVTYKIIYTQLAINT